MTDHALSRELGGTARRAADLILELVTAPRTAPDLERRLEALSILVDDQGQALHELARAVHQRNHLLQGLLERQDCLEHASRRQTLLTENHIRQHVLDPVARGLFPLVDHLRDARRGELNCSSSETLISGLLTQVLEILSSHGVELIEAQVGDPFCPTQMRPMRKKPTSTSEQDRRVASVLQVGFRRDQTVLRHQAVELFIFERPQELVLAGEQEQVL